MYVFNVNFQGKIGNIKIGYKILSLSTARKNVLVYDSKQSYGEFQEYWTFEE